MGKGDRIIIETPGAGGWGDKENGGKKVEEEQTLTGQFKGLMGSLAERAAAQLGA